MWANLNATDASLGIKLTSHFGMIASSMGLNFAVVFTGNFLDKKLGELRDALDAKDDDKTNVIYKHVKRVVDVMRDDMRPLASMSGSSSPALSSETEPRPKHTFHGAKQALAAGFDACWNQ